MGHRHWPWRTDPRVASGTTSAPIFAADVTCARDTGAVGSTTVFGVFRTAGAIVRFGRAVFGLTDCVRTIPSLCSLPSTALRVTPGPMRLAIASALTSSSQSVQVISTLSLVQFTVVIAGLPSNPIGPPGTALPPPSDTEKARRFRTGPPRRVVLFA